MQLAPHQQVEFLVGTAQLDIGTQRHGVVALHQRIEKLMDGDRLVGLIALVEVIALEHARYGVLRRQTNEIGGRQLVHPGGVECDFGLGRIKDLEHLRLIGLGILEHLFAGQRRARRTFATRIADQAGEITYKEDHVMPQILELAQLVDQDRVTQVQIGRRWIETGLDPQRLSALELFDQLGLDQQLFSTALDQRQLLFNRLHKGPTGLRFKGLNHTRSRIKYKARPTM